MDVSSLPGRLVRRIHMIARGDREPLPQEEKWAAIDRVRKAYRLTTLVESGTFLGDTIAHFKDLFPRLYSIELQTDLYNAARKRFAGDMNVTIIQGDSEQMMKGLMPELEAPALFWLDGHYSSEFYIGETYVRTARGDKDTPIAEELKTILTAGAPHVILIDDARLFGVEKDYPSIGRIKKMVRALKPGHEVRLMQDIIAILPKVSP